MLNIRQTGEIFLSLVQGIARVWAEAKDFASLEDGVRKVVQQAGARVLAMLLEGLEEQLYRERPEGLAVVGFRSRGLISTFGELRIKRRLYRERESGNPRFLLDEALGWPAYERLSPRMKEIAVELGLEQSFRRAARILGYIVPGVSAMSVWVAVKSTGENLKAFHEANQRRMFELGQTGEGGREAEVLYLEADGVGISYQRAEVKRGEIKLGVAYEGRKACHRSNRQELTGRRVFGAGVDGQEFWEQASAEWSRTWALEKTGQVLLGGDGAQWVKQGKEYFPGAIYRLDPYHLRCHLLEALAHDAQAYQAVGEFLAQGTSFEALKAELDKAAKRAKGKKRQKVLELARYLQSNWEGIKKSEVSQRLGSIEGQVWHHIARRMKHLGARWTPEGADRMARCLASRANKEIARYITGTWEFKEPAKKQAVVGLEDNPRVRHQLEQWLLARVPALYGPSSGNPWVKHVLRPLTRFSPTLG